MLNFAANVNLKLYKNTHFILGAIFFSSPQRPDRLWGPPSLLYNGYRKFIPRA
jgi:hypothetical protein